MTGLSGECVLRGRSIHIRAVVQQQQTQTETERFAACSVVAGSAADCECAVEV